MTTSLPVDRIYLVDYGTDYERFNIGVATSLVQAQELVAKFRARPDAQYMGGENAKYYWAGASAFDTAEFGNVDEGTFIRLDPVF